MAEDAVAAAKGRRRRCTGTAGGGDMMSALPEHVLQEILSRVGTVKDLFNLAATCRRWLARFTDRTFLRELLCPSAAQGQGLLGFFLQDARRRGICSFLPTPGRGRSSPLGLDAGTMARALTSSLVADGDGAFDYAMPLAARCGIVLMQCVPRHRRYDTRLLLSVCNPVTGQRHLLAPLGTDPDDFDDPYDIDLYCYAIITAADANNAAVGRYTFSQLLVASVELSTSDYAVHLRSYSAATGSWSAPATLNLVNGCRFSLVGQRSAVVHHGAAHWLWRYDDNDGSSLFKLSVQLGGGAAGGGGPVCFAFTRIPVHVDGGGNPLLCVTGDGNLAVVCVYTSHATVSTRRPQQQAGHGYANQAWEHTTAFTIPAAVPYQDIHPMWQPKEKWFHLSRGCMLVIYRSSAVSIVDVHSKTMEKVMDLKCFMPLLNDQMNRTVVPYEMDLVDFFMLQRSTLYMIIRIVMSCTYAACTCF